MCGGGTNNKDRGYGVWRGTNNKDRGYDVWRGGANNKDRGKEGRE